MDERLIIEDKLLANEINGEINEFLAKQKKFLRRSLINGCMILIMTRSIEK